MRPGPRPEAGRRGAPAPLPVPAALQGASPGPREAGGPGRRGRPLAVHAQVEVGDAGTVFVSPGLPAHGVPTSPEKTRGHGDTCLPPLRAPAASPVRLCRDPRFPELDRGRSPSVRLGCCVAPSSLPLGEVHPGGRRVVPTDTDCRSHCPACAVRHPVPDAQTALPLLVPPWFPWELCGWSQGSTCPGPWSVLGHQSPDPRPLTTLHCGCFLSSDSPER